MNKIEKMAARDAHEWMAAEMAYGEGSGTRRKLVWAPISQKMNDVPGYEEAFATVYNSLDLNKYAEAAIKERKKLDRLAKAGKNMRALKSGRLNNLSTGLFLVVGGVIVARQTGYDKVIVAETKKAYARIKEEIVVRTEGRKIRDAKVAAFNQEEQS